MCISNKLILFDIEGVLLKDDKTFDKDVIKCLSMLHDSDVMFGIMTSDLWLKASAYTDVLDPDISIVSDGTQMYRGGDLIWSRSLSVEQTKGIIRDLDMSPDCSLIGVSNGRYIYTNDPSEDGNYVRYRDMSKPFTASVHKIFARTTKEVADKVTEKYQCRSFDFSGDDLCRFISKDANLGAATRYACEVLNIDMKDIVAITTDLTVLDTVGIGIAPDSASEDVKDRAGLIIGGEDSGDLVEFLKEEILVK